MGANYLTEAKKIRITKGPIIEYLKDDSAIIAWSTTARSNSIVRYGTDANNLNQTAQAPWGQETHRVTVKNLKPNTTYYFVVESAQAENTGAMAKSEPAPFMTVEKGQQAMINKETR
jgi:phosphodiesterase/alkaline phosphatase D-like protein